MIVSVWPPGRKVAVALRQPDQVLHSPRSTSALGSSLTNSHFALKRYNKERRGCRTIWKLGIFSRYNRLPRILVDSGRLFWMKGQRGCTFVGGEESNNFLREHTLTSAPPIPRTPTLTALMLSPTP